MEARGAWDRGYIVIWVDGQAVRAHRVAYEDFYGIIPDGMVVDHECHNLDESCEGGVECRHRRCIEPSHLKLKTIGENLLASPTSVASINAAKDRCPQDHLYDEQNTYIYKGHRHCKQCNRNRQTKLERIKMVERLSRKQWDYLISAIVGVVLTGVSYGVGIGLGWTTSHLNWLEVFAVFTSYVSTYLCVVERRFNYPAGAISSVAYALLFFQSQLYNSAILNLYLVPVLVYGWIRWRKDVVTRPVSHVQLRWLPAYAAVTGVLWWIGVVASNAAGGKLAWTDSFILAGTILAQFLLDNKKLENWIVWFAVDVVAVWEYFTSGLQLVGFQYIFFTANAIYGFVIWKRSMNATLLRLNDSNAPYDWALAAGSIR